MRGCATGPANGMGGSSFGRVFAERARDAVAQRLDATLLFLGLGLDYVPELDDVVLDLPRVHVARKVVAIRRLPNISLEFADTFTHDF